MLEFKICLCLVYKHNAVPVVLARELHQLVLDRDSGVVNDVLLLHTEILKQEFKLLVSDRIVELRLS